MKRKSYLSPMVRHISLAEKCILASTSLPGGGTGGGGGWAKETEFDSEEDENNDEGVNPYRIW